MKRKVISSEPLIWFHYLLLVGIVFLAHWLSGIVGLEGLVSREFPINIFGWFYLVIWYYLFLSIFDQIIHYIIKKD